VEVVDETEGRVDEGGCSRELVIASRGHVRPVPVKRGN
jgi:hypothetical protein